MEPWPEDLVDRARGAYLGLAIGDALGATVEFMTPREIRHHYGVHRDIVGGGWLKLPAGAVTDDTTMSLALGDAIVAAGGWDPHAAARAFVAWLRGRPVDCGNTCRRGIRRYLTDGSLSGPPRDGDGGNGALMRNLPVVLATLGDPQAFAHASIGQCHLTHHHALSDAATLAIGRMTADLVQGHGAADVRRHADALVAAHPQFRFDPYPGRAGGYVVDTAQTVLHHYFAEPSFEDCVVATVNRGEDADTTGALAGMLAGARCGAAGLPRRWLRALERRVFDRIERQVGALLVVAGQRRGR